MDSAGNGGYVLTERRIGRMNYQRFFDEAIDQLHAERRYRVFADMERIVGAFPRAIWRSGSEAREITVWCSNDYLGMGQHPDVVAAMQDAGLHLRLHLQRGIDLDHRAAAAELPDPFGRTEPLLDDRGRASFRGREEGLPPQ